MRGPLRAFGHPLHPMLAHAPLALLATSLVWDAVRLVAGDAPWAELARWNLALGLAAALPAAAVGFWDYIALPQDHPAEATATSHMVLILGSLGAFGVSLVARFTTLVSSEVDWPLALACSLVGLGLLAVGGHRGGSLVYRHGLGVDRDDPPAAQE